MLPPQPKRSLVPESPPPSPQNLFLLHDFVYNRCMPTHYSPGPPFPYLHHQQIVLSFFPFIFLVFVPLFSRQQITFLFFHLGLYTSPFGLLSLLWSSIPPLINLLIPGIGCKHSKRLVVLTGAGASTECGIPDYRRSTTLSLSLSTFSFPASLETWMIWQVLLHTVQKRPELLKQKPWTILTGKDMWGLEGGFQSTWSLQQWLQTHNPPGKNKISCMYLTECLVSMLLFRVLLLNACLLRNAHACSN